MRIHVLSDFHPQLAMGVRPVPWMTRLRARASMTAAA